MKNKLNSLTKVALSEYGTLAKRMVIGSGIGGATAALIPTKDGEQRMKNILVGGVIGGTTGAAYDGIKGHMLTNKQKEEEILKRIEQNRTFTSLDEELEKANIFRKAKNKNKMINSTFSVLNTQKIAGFKHNPQLIEALRKKMFTDANLRSRILQGAVNRAVPHATLGSTISGAVRKSSNILKRLKVGVTAGVNKYKELSK